MKKVCESERKSKDEQLCNFEISIDHVNKVKLFRCSCKPRVLKLSGTEEIGKLIGDLVRSKRGSHAIIKLQITTRMLRNITMKSNDINVSLITIQL